MSDHCGRCAYDPGATTGEDACPLNSMYWDFIDHHQERWSENHRMSLMVSNWARRDEADRTEIVERAAEVRERLQDGDL